MYISLDKLPIGVQLVHLGSVAVERSIQGKGVWNFVRPGLAETFYPLQSVLCSELYQFTSLLCLLVHR